MNTQNDVEQTHHSSKTKYPIKTTLLKYTSEPICQTTYLLLLDSNKTLTLTDPCPLCQNLNVRCLIGCHPINKEHKELIEKIKLDHKEDIKVRYTLQLFPYHNIKIHI